MVGKPLLLPHTQKQTSNSDIKINGTLDGTLDGTFGCKLGEAAPLPA